MKEKILELRTQGKSYRQIVEILGCSRSLVCYHCGNGQKLKSKRRGENTRERNKLKAAGLWKHEAEKSTKFFDFETTLVATPSKEILVRLIDEWKSQQEIADIVGVHKVTIKKWLKKFGLKTRNSVDGKPLICRRCGENKPDKFYKSSLLKKRRFCKKCDASRSYEIQKRRRREAVEYKGGKCCKCGYDKCIAALEFHHIDPKTKDPNWLKLRVSTLEKMKEELDKCILVCSNCHRELHYEQNRQKTED